MRDDNWRLSASSSIGHGRVTVGVDRLVRPDGRTVRHAWLEIPETVAVVAVDGDEVIFIKEYRPRLRETVLSCPTGGVEGGESFVEAGARELREETGYVAGDVRLVESYYPVSWLRRRRGVVVATDLAPGPQNVEDDEFIEVRRVPVEDALAVARDGPITGWTLPALLLARESGRL